MSFVRSELNGASFIEGQPEEAFLLKADDAPLLVEACFSAQAEAALLYPRNLTPGFFDLSSGEAGAILQKMRNYRLRLAVVCEPGSVQFSSRFGEVVAEERRSSSFGVFGSRSEALEWLGRH